MAEGNRGNEGERPPRRENLFDALRGAAKGALLIGGSFDRVTSQREEHMEPLAFSSDPREEPFGRAEPENKTGEDCPRRLCLRNAFEQVYPHGG
jgi:hypothetical protein